MSKTFVLPVPVEVVPATYAAMFVGDSFLSVTVEKNGLHQTVNLPRTIYVGANGTTVRSNLKGQTVSHASRIVSVVCVDGLVVSGPR